MASWSPSFEEVMEALETEGAHQGLVFGLLHAMLKSWQYEEECLVWVTAIPGNNIFGSDVVFVNKKVINKLQWSFVEWMDGTAPNGIFSDEEDHIVKMHLQAKSSLPIVVHVRKKTTPVHQEGMPYVFHFHHDLPHKFRLTIAVPMEL